MRFFIISMFLLIASCNSSVDINSLKLNGNNSLVVIKTDLFLNKSKVSNNFSDNCVIAIQNEDNDFIGTHTFDLENNYLIFDANDSKTAQITGIACYARKLQSGISPIVASLHSGKVNYLGDIVIDWKPEKYSLSGFFFGIGGLGDNKGNLKITRSDAIEVAKEKLNYLQNIQSAEWLSVKFNDHPDLVQ